MSVTWFATFQTPPGVEGDAPQDVLDAVAEIIAATPGLTSGRLYWPWAIEGLPFDDGPPPWLQMQLYFDQIAPLEGALVPAGHLQALRDPESIGKLAQAEIFEQAMMARDFVVERGPDITGAYCTFLVHYPGPADDLSRWLQHYIAHHTPVMQRFPGIRGVEVCSRMEWCSALPTRPVQYMQRNKVVFDDATALKSALASPVMQEMRADSAGFPPYAGGNAHFAMYTRHIEKNRT